MPGGSFHPPPGWPVPPGWEPSVGWEPDPSWPPAPHGWQFWTNTPPPHPPAQPAALRRRPALLWALGAVATVAAVVVGVVTVNHFNRRNGPEVIVLRPVDAQGNVQTGWRLNVEDRGNDPIDCSLGLPSRYDVGGSVRSCGGTADSGDACWPAADNDHVLCVRDPFTNVVDLIPASGLSTARKPARHSYIPFALVLDDGTRCRARIGGAWGHFAQQPDWVAYYGCGTNDADFTAVWGPRDDGGDSDGISRDHRRWSVTVGTEDGPLTTHRVTQVYYVGLAGENPPVSK
ncbi:hypothetical protein [Mycobacterium sp. 155]|uniref:hypothetical protein n=1 Tax=Mycobacterium sp. 155 TaxID=1157943 RepID=UPI001E331226|nr:hypothetical protein [Mycobacterium sp. 155]